MSDSILISCSFLVVSISMLTVVLILRACSAANTELSRGGQSCVSVGWGVLQVLYWILHADLLCGTRRENELCLTFVLSFTEAASGEICLINLNFSLKSLSVPLKISQMRFQKYSMDPPATHNIFDSSNAVSWDSIPDIDLRKFNSTSKNSISLTWGGYVKGHWLCSLV